MVAVQVWLGTAWCYLQLQELPRDSRASRMQSLPSELQYMQAKSDLQPCPASRYVP